MHLKKKAKHTATAACKWRARHSKFLRMHHMSEPKESYSVQASKRSVPAPEFTQPRVNSLLSCTMSAKGSDFWSPHAVLDLSQSVDMTRFRNDGKLFCLSTTSQPYLPGKGYMLSTEDMMFLMGFPIHDLQHKQAMHEVGPLILKRMVGNTMDVRVVSFVVLAAMYADVTFVP
jgi:hypothetical protein